MTQSAFNFRQFSVLVATAFPLLVSPSPACAQELSAPQLDIKPQADALLRSAYPADGPGAAVIVTRGDRVIYAAGQGLADTATGRTITTDTAFRLGSIVKQFTAAAVLKLAEEGRLSLNDPIARFFPDWPEPASRATVRQLLNHTSGIQDYSKVPGWIQANRQRAWTTTQLLAIARGLPARAEPGVAFEYNNGGYVLLGAILEQVTKKAWHEVVADKITRPLGLHTIAFATPDRLDRKSASGYTRVNGQQQPVQLSDMRVAHAAGGLNGSVHDMAKWAQALHHGKVINSASYSEMTSPARLVDGSTVPYGFGLRIQEIRDEKAFAHGGAGAGLDTDSIYIPSQNIFVAVFANSDDPSSDPSILSRRLAALAMGNPFPILSQVPVDMKLIESAFGTYITEGGPPRRFFERGGKIFLGRGDDEREVFAAGENRFFFGKNDLAWFRIDRDESGTPVMEVHTPQSTTPIRFTRTGGVPDALVIARDILQSYVGSYQTETIALTITINEAGQLMIAPDGQKPLAMRPVSETEFRIEGGNMRLVFEPAEGRVDAFTLYRGARALHGKRVRR